MSIVFMCSSLGYLAGLLQFQGSRGCKEVMMKMLACGLRAAVSMDHVMKSSVYKDYIERAVAEATLNLVAEIILGKRSRIGEFVSRRWWLPRSPDFGHELDMLEAGLKCLRADVATIGKQRAELKQALLRETSELPRPPSGPVESVFWRALPYRGLNHMLNEWWRSWLAATSSS
ncbi:unnamed protein product [Linum tenue]|uniref:Uncharacterized protein n=1 Tax=Linum tenue TaxID=586396 RepID=A0AAV0MUB1_9ROSI|nr:unnamed protein product [Linum tenue]